MPKIFIFIFLVLFGHIGVCFCQYNTPKVPNTYPYINPYYDYNSKFLQGYGSHLPESKTLATDFIAGGIFGAVLVTVVGTVVGATNKIISPSPPPPNTSKEGMYNSLDRNKKYNNPVEDMLRRFNKAETLRKDSIINQRDKQLLSLKVNVSPLLPHGLFYTLSTTESNASLPNPLFPWGSLGIGGLYERRLTPHWSLATDILLQGLLFAGGVRGKEGENVFDYPEGMKQMVNFKLGVNVKYNYNIKRRLGLEKNIEHLSANYFGINTTLITPSILRGGTLHADIKHYFSTFNVFYGLRRKLSSKLYVQADFGMGLIVGWQDNLPTLHSRVGFNLPLELSIGYILEKKREPKE